MATKQSQRFQVVIEFDTVETPFTTLDIVNRIDQAFPEFLTQESGTVVNICMETTVINNPPATSQTPRLDAIMKLVMESMSAGEDPDMIADCVALAINEWQGQHDTQRYIKEPE